jgi:hypothetical protein
MIVGSFGHYLVETTHDHELAGALGGSFLSDEGQPIAAVIDPARARASPSR